MKDELIRSQIHQAVDHHSEHLQSNPFLAQRIINQERTGEPVVKKRLSIGLVLVIVLMLIAVTALAVALLSPKEIVEQVAVPMAKENDEGEVRQEYSVTGSGVKSQGGIPAGGDCRKAIQPVPLDFWPTENTCRVVGKALPFPPAQRRVAKFRRGAGCPFQRAALLGEPSADGGGKAPIPPRRAQRHF